METKVEDIEMKDCTLPSNETENKLKSSEVNKSMK